jgi:hypothetical protein
MLPVDHPKVEEVIRILNEEIKVDGETMQYILKRTNMEQQMLGQLFNSYVNNDIKSIID